MAPAASRSPVDVVVVGGRVTGAVLATALADAGLTVVVIERDDEVKPVHKPYHVLQADSFAQLRAVGAFDRVRPHLGPFMDRLDLRLGDLRVRDDFPLRPGDPGAGGFIHHDALTSALGEVVDEAAVDVRRGCEVDGVLEENGRVVGVRSTRDGRTEDIRARLVVGADGRSSTLARLVGARKYHRTRTERAYLWSYFVEPRLDARPAFVTHRWGDRFHWSGPTAGDRYLVGVSFAADRLPPGGAPLTELYRREVAACEPMAEITDGCALVGPPKRALRIEGYFREAAGPGWALVGDAGHFKDPLSGRGVGDALHQVVSFAAMAIDTAEIAPHRLDRALTRWWRRRDEHFLAHYWLSVDMASLEPVSPLVADVFRHLDQHNLAGDLLQILSHRIDPTDLVTPTRLASSAVRNVRRGTVPLRAAWADLSAVVGRDVGRRRLHRHPDLAAG